MQERVSKSTPTFVRKQVLLTREQQARLKAVSAATGRAETEIVRAALDAWLETQMAGVVEWKAAWQQAAGMWKDRTELDAFHAERRHRRRERRQRINRLMASGRSR